jgi:K+/H+ antiporter YhaU regulatory subunit KhtT
MKTEVIVALIALTGVIFSGGFALLNVWVQKRITEVKKKQEKNDIYEIQNNVLEQLVPLFEKKDLALDRLADILEEISKRVEFIEKENRQLSSRLDKRCLAPELIQELCRVQELYEAKEVNKGIIDSLLKNDVEHS